MQLMSAMGRKADAAAMGGKWTLGLRPSVYVPLVSFEPWLSSVDCSQKSVELTVVLDWPQLLECVAKLADVAISRQAYL